MYLIMKFSSKKYYKSTSEFLIDFNMFLDSYFKKRQMIIIAEE